MEKELCNTILGSDGCQLIIPVCPIGELPLEKFYIPALIG